MSRRDTIIVSVLINAGLLAILFATAWNDDEDTTSSGVGLSPMRTTISAALPATEEHRVTTHDEVDAVLARYCQPQSERSKPAAPNQDGRIKVVVKRGDSLSSIAANNGVSTSEITKLNNLNSSTLQIGQVLWLPKADKKESRPIAALSSDEPHYYTVQSGDNPWTIAKKHGVPLKKLLELNNLDDRKARRLKAGDRLRVQ